ncbi:MAG: serine protein kinase PrkA [Deltaproteobacteria bacterium]|nr:serine protein kinase PrkA [Deltaproteobacteria bacterium]
MRDVTRVLDNLELQNKGWEKQPLLNYADFLQEVVKQPSRIIRNIYQLYADMIDTFICEEVDEYPDDPESIHYVAYECSELFAKGSERPFFPDRLFANRLVRHVESLSIGAQQNKIYIFDGPHGSGKSTFLNNLLRKFEEYTVSPEGIRYEVVWKLPKEHMSGELRSLNTLTDRLSWLFEKEGKAPAAHKEDVIFSGKAVVPDYFEFSCPSHDNPILMIPRESRRLFFDDLFENDKFKWKLFTNKKYEWVFNDSPCTICSSIFSALMRKHHDFNRVFEFIHARPYVFKRRLGQGISVFNPGDKPVKRTVLQHENTQQHLDALLPESRSVRYLYSHYARTNNGIYALMDIKSHNIERLMELHNIISEGVHKVEELEESVNSLFFALMNPEDKKQLQDLQALTARIEYIHIPYVLDIKTEVDIYREVFGKHLDESFLPRVLHNFARVIIATRLMTKSEAMLEWISDPEKYELYCDNNLQLLKMEIYTGNIPKWLSEDDLKNFTAKRRQRIIAESEQDGWKGFSGRDSIRLFNDFFSHYSRGDKLIDMSMIAKFFKKHCKQDKNILPLGFLDALQHMYNYIVLQEVKESLYYYNEDQIATDIQNYMFAVNFDQETTEVCTFTGEKLQINEELFSRIETRLLADSKNAKTFREDVQKTYTTTTLTQEIMHEGLAVTETSLFQYLYEMYVYNLKEKVLEPFLKNENFRMAVKDFDTDDFRSYDRKIKDDVTFMINNLQQKYRYSSQGAKEICMYVVDNNIAGVFEGQ